MTGQTRPSSAVVTGGAQGLGAEIGLRLADEGYRVALLDVNDEALAATRATIERQVDGAQVLAIAADLADEEHVAKAFATIKAEFERIDVLVSAAGGSGTAPVRDIDDLSLDLWTSVIDNNVTSTFLCAKYAVPIMRHNGFGRIVNFSSVIAGGQAGPLGTVGARLPYATAKAAIIGFTRQLAKDLASTGITVNAIAPGLILPPGGRVRDKFASLPTTDQAAIRAAIPAGRTGTAAEIAAAVSYLASNAAGFTTGSVVTIDGAAS